MGVSSVKVRPVFRGYGDYRRYVTIGGVDNSRVFVAVLLIEPLLLRSERNVQSFLLPIGLYSHLFSARRSATEGRTCGVSFGKVTGP